MDKDLLLQQLAELPLYFYDFIDPRSLEFSERIRWICRNDCQMYGKSWACPPAVGEVAACQKHCLSFDKCLLIGTITEVNDIANIRETLSTRGPHEAITAQVAEMMESQGVAPYILSTEACAICERCAILDGEPCRFPEKMHPCVESQGINLIPTLEALGLPFLYGENVVTWYSLLFFREK